MRVCGIDTGVSGALALIEEQATPQYVASADMPVLAKGTAKKTTRREVNPAALAQLLREWAPDLVVLELVSAMPSTDGGKRGIGAASAFGFGDSFGVVRGVV